VSHIPEAIHSPQLPTVRDFIVSAGFAGAAALLAAIIALCAVLYSSRRAAKRLKKQLEQRERHHQQSREDEKRSAAITQCWERLVWLVETAEIEPAARAADEAGLGLSPELAEVLLKGLLRDAEQLEDHTLAEAVSVYLAQFGLVLAQHGGPLTEISGTPAPSANEKPDGQAARPAPEKPTATTGADEKLPTPRGKVTPREGRHR
jgi:hypothetical protein